MKSAALLLAAGLSVSALPVEERATATSSGPTVTLDYSTFQGFEALGINHWLGMNFAAAPTGDARWRAPADPPTTTGVQSANSFKPLCIGTLEPNGHSLTSDATYAEDCLGISVSAPANANNNSNLPVMLYFSGGGYANLTSANYNFTQFISTSNNNVIAVQANYRVGALGFLAGSEVSTDGSLNAGLLDTRKALQWVNKYISHFGGNPNHVVLFGGSAGAGAVSLQLTAYGGRDDKLFVGAGVDAVFSPQVNNASFSEYQFTTFANNVGCGSASDKLTCLRAADISSIIPYDVPQSYPGHTQQAEYIWTPVVDGTFLQDYPLREFENGNFVKVPLLSGDVDDEGTIFAYNAATPADVSTFISANYPQLTSDNLTTINSLYPLAAPFPFHAPYFPSAEKAYGEAAFICPTTLITRLMANAGLANSVWNYRFDQGNTIDEIAGYGVPHNIDLGAIFGPYANSIDGVASLVTVGLNFGEYSNENAAVVPLMMDYVVSFVTTLNPNTAKSPAANSWQPFSSGGVEQRVVIANNGTYMENLPSDLVTRCSFWQGAIPLTGQ